MKRLGALVGAALAVAALTASVARANFSEYEVEFASASLSSNQAGAHADLTTEFALKTALGGGDLAQTRDVVVSLPPGLLGDPTKFPQCTMAELEHVSCPQSSQVGLTEALLEGNPRTIAMPIYNMVRPEGGNIVARLGFHATFYPITINIRVHPEDEYRVTASLEGIASVVALRSATTKIWGVPGSAVHDLERITPQEGENGEQPLGGRPSELPPVPFLSNPTRCGVPLSVSISADTYQLPEVFSTKIASLGSLSGCGNLDFRPEVTAEPTTSEAAAPTGLDVAVRIPQDETPEGLATSHLRDARVTLPEGMTLSPGAADGLQACSADEAGYLSGGPGRCPDASKIGSAELDVVGLEHPLHGSIYQRTPEPGKLFRIWIVADELGVHVALPGEIEVDKNSGQITSSFAENPQVPLREAKLHIFGGARAPLANPTSCGTYRTAWQLAPWSGTAPVAGTAPMSITGNCKAGGFSPQINVGTTSPLAGAFAPLVTEVLRNGDEQNISGLEFTLPPGLLAKLRGVPLCDVSAARNGNCPPGSQIGRITVAAGPGSDPLWIPQPGRAATAVYLTGPYEGAPFGLSVEVPAQAGPFDLGTVNTLAALDVEPESARVVVHSDPLPQFLEGVPVSYRTLRVAVDRRDFTLNPTSCRPLSTSATLTSSEGKVTTAASPFRVAGCGELSYSPKLSLSFEGSTKRTGNPGIKAILTQSGGQSNTRSATVILPQGEFIDNAHITTPCTRVQFDAHVCPKKSILGYATAITPLLANPLKGPVYFRSNGGARELPDLVADLHGAIHIVLVGYIDSVAKKGSEVSRVRTRFEHVPDAPVTKFTMKLFGGRRGLIENTADLCLRRRRASIELDGQNGRRRKSRPVIGDSCGHGR